VSLPDRGESSSLAESVASATLQKCVVSATVVACVSATTGSVNVINTVAALSHQPAIIGSQFATRFATRDSGTRPCTVARNR
jgi:hypothetical protein